MFQNTYGIEIECYLPEGVSHRQAAHAITARGVETHEESYNHITRPTWKIVTDGSLGNDYERGMEVVSPVLSGPAGFEALKVVLATLNDLGCTVSKKCGVHVHVGVASMPLQSIKNLLKLYAANEHIIDGFVPPSRRASLSTWCRSLTGLSFTAIDRARSFTDLVQLFGMGPIREMINHDGRRYHKVNILPIAAFTQFGRGRPTVEFRQHSGTLDFAKVSNWTALCLRMVAAANSQPTTPTASTQINQARPGSKSHMVGEMMLRPTGVTGREAVAATGWPSISLPQQAAACGLTFTTQRIGRTVRYFANAAAANAAAAPATAQRATLASLMQTIGAEETEVAFFQARTANLSGPVAWAA